MARKGENIYRRKDGRWEGRWIISREYGKAKYGYVYARTYSEVRSKLSARRQKGKAHSRSTGGRTLRCYAEEWLSAVRLKNKESTYIKYRAICEKHILPALGELSPNRITTQIAGNLLHERLQSGLSPRTVCGIKTILKMLLNFAGKDDADCDFSALKIRQPHKDMRVLSVEEQRSLCGYLKENMDQCKMGVFLCLFTGMRVGEICALRWSNVSLDNRTIRIEETMQRINTEKGKTKVITTLPKSSYSCRIIPITDELAALMSKFRALGREYVLSGSEDVFIEPRTLQYRFKKYLKLAGIKNANFHALRHTFATRCVESGVDVKSLSEILGHSNIGITLSRYVHSSMDFKRENMEKLVKLM